MIFENKIKAMYRGSLFSRADIASDMKFFTYKDFEGLLMKEYSFKTSKGDKLSGAFYYYPSPIKNRVVVFDHGMSSGGHLAYMREIEKLARGGYLVFSYDHTGCASSEGESTGGFSQSLCDLDACLTALKGENILNGYDISVVGHSWGAYSCLNIANYHPDVSHIVAISGFVSVDEMHRQLFSGLMSFYRKAVYSLESESNPQYVKSNAIEALSSTDAKVLLIYSADDKIVKAKRHYEILKSALSDRKNTKFILTCGKAHNPNYTADAVKYLGEFFGQLNAKRKNGELETDEQKRNFVEGFDWWRMTEQDNAVWDEVFALLAK